MARIRGMAQAVFVSAVAGVSQLAHAGITVTAELIPLPATGAANQALAADGWIGVAIVAHSDATSQGVLGFDFLNNSGPITNPGIRGVSGSNGFINRQQGVTAFDEEGNPIGFTGQFTPSIVGPNTAPGFPAPTTAPDSFWINFPAILGANWVAVDPLAEDANMAAPTPIADPANQSANWGITTVLRASGTFGQPTKPMDVTIAYVIAKMGTQIHVKGTFIGAVADTGSFVDVMLPGPLIPEPATLGVLALGGLSLLARHRRTSGAPQRFSVSHRH